MDWNNLKPFVRWAILHYLRIPIILFTLPCIPLVCAGFAIVKFFQVAWICLCEVWEFLFIQPPVK